MQVQGGESSAPQRQNSGGSELLRELRRENMQLQQAKQQLEAASKLSSGGGLPQALAPTFAPPAATPPTPPAPAAPQAAKAVAPAAAAKEEAEEEGGGGGGSAFGALNLVGIIAAGGLTGYLSLQRKDAEQAQASFEKQLTTGGWMPVWSVW